jgi:hypothetical protein
MFSGVAACQPDQHQHASQQFDRTQAGEQRQIQAIFDQGDQLPHRLENRHGRAACPLRRLYFVCAITIMDLIPALE